MGKTRLALRMAAEVSADYPDGVWLAELGELRDAPLLTDVVAGALGVRDEPVRHLGDVLVEYLSSRRLLLVLDNCEQVVDEAAKLVETLLRTCPELRILATSREALGIRGESVRPFAPFTVSEAGDGGSGDIALFAERATAAVSGYHIADNDKDVVARICSRLDGLPLAIELAAARLRAMSPEQILHRIDDRYALLTRGCRGAPARQQALAWSVDWSYDLCTPAEQRLWGQLSISALRRGLTASMRARWASGPGTSSRILASSSRLVRRS